MMGLHDDVKKYTFLAITTLYEAVAEQKFGHYRHTLQQRNI